MISPGSRVMFTLNFLHQAQRPDANLLQGTVTASAWTLDGVLKADVKWDGDFLKTRVRVKDLVKL